MVAVSYEYGETGFRVEWCNSDRRSILPLSIRFAANWMKHIDDRIFDQVTSEGSDTSNRRKKGIASSSFTWTTLLCCHCTQQYGFLEGFAEVIKISNVADLRCVGIAVTDIEVRCSGVCPQLIPVSIDWTDPANGFYI